MLFFIFLHLKQFSYLFLFIKIFPFILEINLNNREKNEELGKVKEKILNIKGLVVERTQRLRFIDFLLL